MKKRHNSTERLRAQISLFSFKRFVGIFFLLGFAVTCSFLLFLSGLELPEEHVRERAPDTFINMIFVSFALTVFDVIRRKVTVDRAMKKILYATQKISEGDFSVRIKARRFAKPRDELDIIIRNLNIMAEQLSGTETLKADFIANVSHELKTPLAVISNYAQIIQSPDLDDAERNEYARILVNTSNELSELISNILKLNKLENQQIMPDVTRFNLSEQLCQCLFQFENEIEKKNIVVETDIKENVFIESDPDILTVVWNNLISNAIKFNKEGGTLCITLKTDKDRVVVTVLDTGCGISREVGKRIFDKFYQGDTSHSSQGNGLGLALVKRIVDIVGGDILVESEVERGSAFTITLHSSAEA